MLSVGNNDCRPTRFFIFITHHTHQFLNPYACRPAFDTQLQLCPDSLQMSSLDFWMKNPTLSQSAQYPAEDDHGRKEQQEGVEHMRNEEEVDAESGWPGHCPMLLECTSFMSPVRIFPLAAPGEACHPGEAMPQNKEEAEQEKSQNCKKTGSNTRSSPQVGLMVVKPTLASLRRTHLDAPGASANPVATETPVHATRSTRSTSHGQPLSGETGITTASLHKRRFETTKVGHSGSTKQPNAPFARSKTSRQSKSNVAAASSRRGGDAAETEEADQEKRKTKKKARSNSHGQPLSGETGTTTAVSSRRGGDAAEPEEAKQEKSKTKKKALSNTRSSPRVGLLIVKPTLASLSRTRIPRGDGGGDVAEAFRSQGHFSFTTPTLRKLAETIMPLLLLHYFEPDVDLDVLARISKDSFTERLRATLRVGHQSERIGGNAVQINLVQGSVPNDASPELTLRFDTFLQCWFPMFLHAIMPWLVLAFQAIGIIGVIVFTVAKLLLSAPGAGLQLPHSDALALGIAIFFFPNRSARTTFFGNCKAWFIECNEWLLNPENEGTIGWELRRKMRSILWDMLQREASGGTVDGGTVTFLPAWMLHAAPENIFKILRALLFFYAQLENAPLADLMQQAFSHSLRELLINPLEEEELGEGVWCNGALREAAGGQARAKKVSAATPTSDHYDYNLKQMRPLLADLENAARGWGRTSPAYPPLVWEEAVQESQQPVTAHMLAQEVALEAGLWFVGKRLQLRTTASGELMGEPSVIQIVPRVKGSFGLKVVISVQLPVTLKMNCAPQPRELLSLRQKQNKSKGRRPSSFNIPANYIFSEDLTETNYETMEMHRSCDDGTCTYFMAWFDILPLLPALPLAPVVEFNER